MPLIREKQAQIDDLCRQYGVSALWLFGSGVREDWDPERSDLDFAVEFVDKDHFGPINHRFFDLLTSLSAVFGRPVDLIIRTSIRNPRLRTEVDGTKEIAYLA